MDLVKYCALLEEARKKANLPRVVGLTASPVSKKDKSKGSSSKGKKKPKVALDALSK